MDLFGNPVSLPAEPGFSSEEIGEGVFRLKIPDGELWFAPEFYAPEEARECFDWLTAASAPLPAEWRELDPEQVNWRHIPWRQQPIRMFGKWIAQPRWTAWFGDPGMTYTYSGLRLEPNAWNAGLLEMKSRLEAMAGTDFNSVLLNLYRDGSDHMSWHTDDEPELGRDPVIASLNFGAGRRFLFRRKDQPKLKFEIPLGSGSALVMRGSTQHHWQHSVPKQKKVQNTRINLTFRKIISE